MEVLACAPNPSLHRTTGAFFFLPGRSTFISVEPSLVQPLNDSRGAALKLQISDHKKPSVSLRRAFTKINFLLVCSGELSEKLLSSGRDSAEATAVEPNQQHPNQCFLLPQHTRLHLQSNREI